MSKTNINQLFDQLLSTGLSNVGSRDGNYPPTNIYSYNLSEQIVVEMAVAGFTKDELAVEFNGKELSVRGAINQQRLSDRLGDSPSIMQQQCSLRSFKKSFAVSGNYKVDRVKLEHGMLMITLVGDNAAQVINIE